LPEQGVKIRWLGHASFKIISSGGLRIVTDPFGSEVPYPEISEECDAVTVSHQHHDHNAVNVLKGNPAVLNGIHPDTGSFNSIDEKHKDVRFSNVASYHDMEQGEKRGENSIFIIDTADIRMVHLGDLGHDLDRWTVEALGMVDILFIPVGGYYTINAVTAKSIVEKIKPCIVVPMHYNTKYVSSWPISPVERFLETCGSIIEVGSGDKEVSRKTLPSPTQTWVFNI
jgi:L-ascorbate metabolism protein UlaG (beta-lactamase superfamily)